MHNHQLYHWWFNSLTPERFERIWVIFKDNLVIDSWGITCEIALRWMSPDLPDDKSTLAQVMAWCLQAPSHYLSQCWPRSMLPNDVIRPQWVNLSDTEARIFQDTWQINTMAADALAPCITPKPPSQMNDGISWEKINHVIIHIMLS